MGSRGIRRRKRRRPLPVPRDTLGWPTPDETPPVMWSEPGSGFEANQYSPAGQMQRQWWFIRRAGRTRFGRPVITLVAAFWIAAIVIQVIQMVRSVF